MKLFVEIQNYCEICTKYKQLGLKPIRVFLLSREFNDTVSVDLKEISGTKLLHIIDNATHFIIVAVVHSKWKKEIVDAFIKHSIAISAAPGKILSDNGGEFNYSLLLNMAEQFIILKTTAAESPWSNDMVERHNTILAKTIEKLILDSNNKYSIDVVIAWTVTAKNSLNNCYGYSPN